MLLDRICFLSLVAIVIKTMWIGASINDAIIFVSASALISLQLYFAHVKIQKINKESYEFLEAEIANLKNTVSALKMGQNFKR